MENDEQFTDRVFVVKNPEGGISAYENVNDILSKYNGGNIGLYTFHEMVTFRVVKSLEPSKEHENNPRTGA